MCVVYGSMGSVLGPSLLLVRKEEKTRESVSDEKEKEKDSSG